MQNPSRPLDRCAKHPDMVHRRSAHSRGLILGLRYVLLASACAVLFATQLRAAERKSNFIVINIDDLGYGDIGPFGSKNPTPQLDRMAREGRLLTSHYAATVCSPSRAALMTGCYPKRVLAIRQVLFPGAEVGLNPSERTIAEVLRDAGYATACIGKWHLGDQPEFLPRRQGFDYYLGLPYSNDMGPIADGAKSNPGRPLPDVTKMPTHEEMAKNFGGDETGIKGSNQPPLPLVENETVIARVRQLEQSELTRRYTEKAVQLIREHRNRPFFLYVAHTAMHFPLYPAKPFVGKTSNGLFADWVTEVDASVGEILDTVRKLELERNTFVIFTSDNGGAVGAGSSNSPLRGGKATTWEGGIRVPTIAWWPGKVPAGTSTDAITTVMDFLPTFARLAGASVPTDRTIDGRDAWPVIAGLPDEVPREEFYYFGGLYLTAVRAGIWKLRTNGPELFNLADDIGESKNLAEAHPEIVARLQALVQAMNADLGVSTIGPGCRPLGRVPNPQPLIAHDGTVRAEFAGQQKRFP